MRISEFRDLLANDGFAATFQTMGQYRTELLRSIDKFRAQADARPVAWRVTWHDHGGNKFGPRYFESEEAADDFAACEAVASAVVVPLYTHPEASAPGLSEDEWLALAERHIRADWNSEQPDGYLNAVKALVQDAMSLTRASAATVAEPSDTLPERDQSKPAEQQGLFRKFIVQRVDGSDAPGGKHHGCEYFVLDMTHDQHAAAALRAYAEACAVTHPQLSADLRARHGAAQQQAEPNDGDEIACSSCGLTMDQSRALAAQQAEPGADERALKQAVERLILEGKTVDYVLTNRKNPDDARRCFAEAADRVTKLIAAQSGQRAGVEEEGWQLVPIEPTPEMLEQIKFLDDITDRAMTARYKAMLAAAPTQQVQK